MSAGAALFRVYRPILLPFAGIVVVVHAIITSIVASHGEMNFSMWLVLIGSATKYWLFVVGIMLVAMQLRQFVTNGVTRHEFLAAVGAFGLTMSASFAAAVVLGHQAESLALEAFGARGPDYPTLTLGGMVAEFGHVLPVTAGYFVSGGLIAIGFYRWRAWIGLVVMLAGAIPAAAADGLLGINEFGDLPHRLPYAAALAISVAATAIGAAAFHRAMSDVPIRRTAG